MQTQRQLLRRSSAGFLFPSLSPSLNFPHTPINYYNSNNYNNNNNNQYSSLCSAHKTSLWLAQQLDTTAISAATPPEVGPIEIPPSIPFDDSGALQTAASVLLSGAFTLFLFRTFRRRARRAKQMRLRSSGAKNSVAAGKGKSRSSPEEAFLGAVIAAVFCLLLYKFTTAIELSLNRQTLSNNYSVRQITITIRTIINGICYLATFVFGFNSVGLFLYSGQLALDSTPPLNKPSEDQTPDKIKDKNDE
ncbi:hypothetical protein CASFOL_024426 [Castilleja foliolosa]|uniref:Transmembrane protein n=1 Tax=Castilleja foliolosa TaxID=1961234 RepID=A0ABD3CS76_9LAMI